MASLAGIGLINTHPFISSWWGTIWNNNVYLGNKFLFSLACWRSLLPQAYLLTNLLKNLMCKNIPLLHLIRKQCKVTSLLLFKFIYYSKLFKLLLFYYLLFKGTSLQSPCPLLETIFLPFLTSVTLTIYFTPFIEHILYARHNIRTQGHRTRQAWSLRL